MPALQQIADRIDWFNDRVGRAASWLTLPVVACLFLQIPLREIVHNYYQQTNDIGQIFHATLFMTCAAYAMRWNQHVRVDIFHRLMGVRTRAIIELVGTIFFLWPWLALMAWYGGPVVFQSWRELEAFPDDWHPGFFLLRTNLIVLVALVGLQSLASVARAVLDLRRR
jgi:TRAP-type mannitol/chloroaromatic compound transport system permease small subunit